MHTWEENTETKKQKLRGKWDSDVVFFVFSERERERFGGWKEKDRLGVKGLEVVDGVSVHVLKDGLTFL